MVLVRQAVCVLRVVSDSASHECVSSSISHQKACDEVLFKAFSNLLTYSYLGHIYLIHKNECNLIRTILKKGHNNEQL